MNDILGMRLPAGPYPDEEVEILKGRLATSHETSASLVKEVEKLNAHISLQYDEITALRRVAVLAGCVCIETPRVLKNRTAYVRRKLILDLRQAMSKTDYNLTEARAMHEASK